MKGKSGATTRYYCKPTPFKMDLNLLDACIYHFVERLTPDLEAGSQCSVIRQMSALLDQTGEGDFDIFDVDACIKTFLNEEPCNSTTNVCENSCETDATCGDGLFCNTELHRCERECGLIISRDNIEAVSLDRKCTGRLEVCDYERGKCNAVKIENSSCQMDRDCPVGAYCLTGQCQPRCYRTLDCPDSTWFCSTDNTCLPKPRESDDNSTFNPKEYSIVYSVDEIQLDPFQNRYSVPLLIMNLKTGKQVFDSPSVAFGYRLEAKYERKQSAKCSGDLTALSAVEQNDCLIGLDTNGRSEEFLTLGNPFGTVYGDGDATTEVSVNSAAEKLSPGYYPVLLTAYFTNGQSTTTRITFRKPSPSGEYEGRMSSYLGSPAAHIANSNVAMRLFIKTPEEVAGAQPITWDDFLTDNNLAREPEFIDITEGYEVFGYVHAAESLLFDVPKASVKAENEIPIKGIYSPQIGRMRLVSVLDLEADYCRNSAGAACNGAAGEWSVSNGFKRPIRRIVEFIGPFRAAERLFEGMYRETISGLAPHDFTVEGGFRLVQQTQSSETVALSAPLLASTASIDFPATASIIEGQVEAMKRACGATATDTLKLKSALEQYLANYGAAAPVFPSVILEKRLRDAITTPNNASAKLTLTEYLNGQITLCSSPDDVDCIDKKQLDCGIAFFRHAILQGWVDRAALGLDVMGQPASPVLFCNRSTIPTEDTCADSRATANATGAVLLQDHNRFYRELTQAHAYQANSAWTDAFYTLYKALDDPNSLASSSAFAYKQTKMSEAVSSYDSARAEMLTPAAAAVMYSWPMARFQRRGQDWLRQMQTVSKDRLDAWLEVADLKRRVIRTANLDGMHTFAKHVVAQEYLVQVYLAELQRTWEGLNFAYSGGASDVLSRGELLLAKLSDSRNPLGFHPDRVYFENSDVNQTNWQAYRTLVKEGIVRATTTVRAVNENLHNALVSKFEINNKLREVADGRNASLDEICGTTESAPACRVNAVDKLLATSCRGDSCAYDWSCDGADEDGRCGRVIKLFADAVSDVSCRSDIEESDYKIALGTDTSGNLITRACNHGRVGNLLQERVKLDLQRKDAKRRVESLLRSIAREQKELEETRASSSELREYLEAQRVKFAALEAGVAAANFAFEAAQTAASSADCMVIVGMAAGTNCPQKAVSTALIGAAVAGKFAVVPALQLAMDDMGRAKEIKYQEASADKEIRNLRLQLDGLVAEVENIISEYAMLTQQLYSIDMQVADAVGAAQNIASRFAEQTNDIVAQLVGQDSGSTLRAGQLVRASDAEFRSLLIMAYKMTRAFLHRYNYADAEMTARSGTTWTNRVYELLTVADVDKLVEDLTDQERKYCGEEGIDCDSANNRQVFPFSVREQLFPELRDIVDPNTGNFLTAGEQFHNIITSSRYRRRRVLTGEATEHIEIPFTISANDLGTTGSAAKPVMLERGDCNHIIAADRNNASGTIALKAVLTRASALKYKIYRGGTDHMRSCYAGLLPGSTTKMGIVVNTFKVGSPVIESATQKAFQVPSANFDACVNNEYSDQNVFCWNYFVRDRSLAAPDWILSIPLENQQWVVGLDQSTGAPIPEKQRGLIEDLVVNIRYSSRASSN